ncbi:MAG: protein kinase domain-containing protein [Acidimicrobiales bacterium]
MQGEETTDRVVGGRYRLLEALGRGGMGTVWRAVDGLLKREVAVKHAELPLGLDGRERAAVRQRVMREAQAAARLSHHASVTVFDVLEEDGSVYIVMELVDAANLSERVDSRGPLTAAEAAQLGLELVGALEAAHRQGIVHRDVKPSNVMLPPGAVKLADFGIASVKDHPSLTSTGQVLGSPSYMAPEQALGQPIGPEADWWGLGATLYFAVEGRPPFERPGALPTLTAVVSDSPAATTNAGALAPVLERLLAKEPAQRPGASELRRLLSPIAAAAPPAPGPPVAAAPPATSPPAAAGPPATSPPVTAGAPATSRYAPTGPPAPAAVRRPAATADEPVRTDPPPAPRPPAARPDRPPSGDPDRRRAQRSMLGALLLVAVLLAAAVWSRSRGDDGPPQAGQSERTATSATTAPAGDGVPADWVTYTDPKVGYRVDHPPGWKVRPLDATRTDITDPATGSYLRVDWTATPGPSPEGAWEALSQSFGSRHEAYQEIAIEPTTYNGFDAATWEYAYTARGARLHAVNLGLVTGTHGFALNFQTPEDRWASSQPLFAAFKASFRPPG